MIDLEHYRQSDSEQERVASLVSMAPKSGETMLDLGARDGYLSIKLQDRFDRIYCADLTLPTVCHPKVKCILADGRDLPFPNDFFDFVLCAEVLEHIPRPALEQVSSEIARVSKSKFLIGVPYRQDLRLDQSTCRNCGRINPPWGHVNSFDLASIQSLFPSAVADRIDYVGHGQAGTSSLATYLMNFAGNPYGAYGQEEPCLGCGGVLDFPPPRSVMQKVATRIALNLNRVQRAISSYRPNWVHILFQKAK